MRHFEEPVDAVCKHCQRPFCERCLVYSFGPKKPPYCVGCALTASGVRNTKITPTKARRGDDRDEAGDVPTFHKRLVRAERRASKVAARSAARAGRRNRNTPQPVIADADVTDRPNDLVPAPAELSGTPRYVSH